LLKGQCYEIFYFRFFHESVSAKTLSIQLRRFFRIFSKGREDIRSSRCTTGVVDAGGTLPPVSVIPAENLPLESLTPVANLPPVSTTPAVPLAKFTAGVVDTGGAS
jgi:hypothetical protein